MLNYYVGDVDIVYDVFCFIGLLMMNLLFWNCCVGLLYLVVGVVIGNNLVNCLELLCGWKLRKLIFVLFYYFIGLFDVL